ncbi:phosphatidylglycerophosphate phosphatase 1, chloroplastic/mitochondrial-like isoform X2 [Musa acuminata AAA Group]|uniref:phosphatidylglycerophosphate phosphatase 1, chloroplastic/mitochondrial-like isoform X2 n=1 Tax=Musa acuminata AAA Group TaxID=214697 RepID=UPI0031D6DEBB
MLPISSLPFSHRSANPIDPSSSSSSFPLTQEGRRRRRGVQNNNKNSVRMGISSNSSSNWQWQRALGQLFNREGAASLLSVAASEPRLALPHLSVPDIRWVDWPTLHRLGFRGVVFDKDNTLTAPYSLSLWPPLDPSFRLCRSAFPAGSIAVFSNSAGLKQFDPDGEEAKTLEKSIGGIHVIRHEVKKPAGTAEDIERYFGCPASLLVMVGDRIFTDVVYGNKHGFLTILTEPLCLSEEPFIVKQVRKLERLLVNSHVTVRFSIINLPTNFFKPLSNINTD